MELISQKGRGFFKKKPEEVIQARLKKLDNKRLRQNKQEELIEGLLKRAKISKDESRKKKSYLEDELSKLDKVKNVEKKKEALPVKGGKNEKEKNPNEMEILDSF